MTCGHCVSSVTEEVIEIPGVTGVEVDLASGLVTVGSDARSTTPPSRPRSRRPDTKWRPRHEHPAKLGAYALGLAVVFGGAGRGQRASARSATAAPSPAGNDDHGAARTAPSTRRRSRATLPPGGLQVSQNGYTLTPATTEIKPGEATDFRFTVIGPGGRPSPATRRCMTRSCTSSWSPVTWEVSSTCTPSWPVTASGR